MGKEFTMLEGFERGEKEIELSLELSIGGNYRKSENPKKVDEENIKGPDFISRSDFYCVNGDLGTENGLEFVDLNRKREIQALRRQEARKKREEKLKRGMGSRGINVGGCVEDKLWSEAQQFQSRVGDRETKENENFSAEAVRKKEKNGINSISEAAKDLNLSLNNGVNVMEIKIQGTSNSCQQIPVQCFYPYLPCANGYPGWGVNAGKGEVDKIRPGTYSNGNSSMDCDSIHSDRKAVSDGSFERSSAISDYQSMVQKGGSLSNSDTGSNSSSSHMLEQLESNVSLAKIEPKDGSVGAAKHTIKKASSSIPQLSPIQLTEKSKSDTNSNRTTGICLSQADNRAFSPLKESNGIISKPSKPQNQIQKAASLSHMPCVSTTGNGPNGKTITGFLYKYTRSEVSIMCVCHGSSFSPAGFVEHAGGIDISHPLRHITVVPSAFG
ncbi:ninja-family protein 4-like [Forsythia ovata]|uniref:Ninja-family protein n=1 Tax=Forsythia ovata TaxID=205694 RepID=A0ABD1RIL5_9LAMI